LTAINIRWSKEPLETRRKHESQFERKIIMAAEFTEDGFDSQVLSADKPVLVDFWATWCGPCRQESPNVVEAYGKYKSKEFKNAKGFEVFSVTIDKDEKAWKQAIKEDRLSWKNHVIDKNGIASANYGVSTIPSAFLIDGEGHVIASGGELRGMKLHIQIDKQLK
jgi:thiol-disulfide isomerase/thioredoxin